MSFLGDIFFFNLCMLGLGEAAIVLIGKKEVTLQRALSASLLPLAATGVVGVVGLLIVSIPAQWSGILPAVILEGVVLVFALHMNLIQDLLNSHERFGTTSLLSALRVATTAAMTTLLLSLTPLEIEGAVLAALCGVAVSMTGQVVALRRMGVSFRPVWDRAYLMRAAKLGVVLQGAYLLMAMSQRVDQLVVYSLLGTVDGGRYAVALTLGLLAGFVPVAISHASFPRLAHIADDEVWPLTAQTARVGLIGGAFTAAVLAVLIPVFTPLVFGESYAHSIPPALVLMAGGLVWSVQWILARAWAARGRPSLLLLSFLLTVTAMLLLDLVLIPAAGLMGAALASVLGSTVGLVACLVAYRRTRDDFRASLLVPRASDVKLLVARGRELLGGAP